MNRNLKRVLSVALMLVVLAVNFTIPAMASASITVSYTDLLSNTLTGAQGTLFFETSPGTNTPSTGLDTGSFNRSYAPLEVPTSGTARDALQMAASEWVRFEVTADTAGYYSVDLISRRQATTGADIIIRTESSIIETTLARSTTFASSNDIGYVYLAEGSNYIYVDNKSASAAFNFRSMTLTLDESADASLVKLLAPVEGANEIADLTVAYDDGYNQTDVTGATLTFPLDIATDGKYKVSVMGIAGASNTVSVDFGGDAKSATVNNDAYGYTELGVFPLTEGNYTMTLGGFINYSLAWVKVEYVSPYETGLVNESFSDGATVARGTDNLAISFNDNMLDTAAAALTVDGTEIPVAVDVDGAAITVSFLETLAYETEYLLEVTGLQGVNDENTLPDRAYTFTTGDDSADEGTEALDTPVANSHREAVTITGTLMSSTGHGIKGRTVVVTDADGNEVAAATSGDNGVYTASFNIPMGTDAGAYTYTVTSEYGATDTAVVSYVSELEELRILGLFLGAATPDAVYQIFEDYGEILLIPDYAADCSRLANDDLFLAHFQQKSFSAVSEVAPFYNKMLELEGMNQATTGYYIKSNYLNDAAACELIGIASDKLNLVITNDTSDSKKTSFADKIAQDTRDNGASTSEEAFLERIEALLDAWLLETNSITPTSLDLTAANAIAYYAGEIAIPLDFQAEQTKVKGIEVVVTTMDDNLLTNAQAVVEGAIFNEVVIDRDANTATFTIEFEYDANTSYDEVGKISLQASVVATHDIDVDATVIYRLTSGDSFVDMPIAVTGGSVRTTVYPTPGESQRPSTGTTGGGGYVAPPKEIEDKTGDIDEAPVYFFDDMSSALWAQDMVHTLVGKGVISQNADRAFRPLDNVTREEFVKMIITVIGSHNPSAVSTLSDVSADHWASSYIATAQELGIVQGSNNSFGLGNNITRQDMAVMIYRTFEMLGMDLTAGETAFADSAEIAGYAKSAVSVLEKLGIINGMGDNTFAPKANATRAQAAKVIYVMMEVLGI